MLGECQQKDVCSIVESPVCYTGIERIRIREVVVTLKSLPLHRRVVVIWHVLVLAMLAWSFFVWREGDEVHWLWMPLFATPLIVLFATLSEMQPQHRSVAYWVMAAVSIPSAAAGITSITGWMFIVSVILLIWAARRENPAEELVQM